VIFHSVGPEQLSCLLRLSWIVIDTHHSRMLCYDFAGMALLSKLTVDFIMAGDADGLVELLSANERTTLLEAYVLPR
jgi:hypothetical protein